jgi:hypothetical protein
MRIASSRLSSDRGMRMSSRRDMLWIMTFTQGTSLDTIASGCCGVKTYRSCSLRSSTSTAGVLEGCHYRELFCAVGPGVQPLGGSFARHPVRDRWWLPFKSDDVSQGAAGWRRVGVFRMRRFWVCGVVFGSRGRGVFGWPSLGRRTSSRRGWGGLRNWVLFRWYFVVDSAYGCLLHFYSFREVLDRS